MTEETQLSTEFRETDLVPSNDEHFKTMSSVRNYLPNLKLYSGQARAVQQGKITIAHWGLQKTKDEITDLGKTVDVIFFSYRYKAVEKVNGQYIAYYDPSSPEFKRTKAKAQADRNSGNMAGIEFLAWLPSIESFAIWFACSTSALDISKEVTACFGKGVTLSSKLVNWQEFTWHAPVQNLAATEVGRPAMEDLQAVGTAFRSPKKQTRETVDGLPDEEDDRR